MQTERLQEHALKWLKERPTLAKEQLSSPVFVLQRMVGEVSELLEAIEQGDLDSILDEWTDVANFFASAEHIMESMGITAEMVDRHSHFKYSIRNSAKYRAEGYQNGTPAKEQLNHDANMWFFAQAYLGSSWNQNPEFY